MSRKIISCIVPLLFLLVLCLSSGGKAKAQTYNIAPIPCPQFFSATGQPLAGGFLYTYASGTLTPLATYTDYTGTIQNSNPIILNAGGFPVSSTGSCGLFLNSLATYRFVLQNSSSVQQYLVDGITTFNPIYLLSQANTWTQLQTFSGGILLPGVSLFQLGSLPSASPYGTVNPTHLALYSQPTNYYINNPDLYVSRVDTTPGQVSGCPTYQCGAPVERIDVQNTNTGSMSSAIGLYVNATRFQATNPLNTQGGNAIGVAATVADSASANNVDMRGFNGSVTVLSVPAGLDNVNSTRSAFGSEMDSSNSTGTDCAFQAGAGGGNYCGGNTSVALGTNSSTVGFAVGTGAISGKGFLDAFNAAGFVNNGFDTWAANSAPSTVSFGCYAGGTTCFEAGGVAGYLPAHNSGYTQTQPTVGFLADPNGISAGNNSISSVWRAFGADTAHVNEWTLYQNNSLHSMRFGYGSACASWPCASYTDSVYIDSSGDIGLIGTLKFGYGSFSSSNVYIMNGTPSGVDNINLPGASSSTVIPATLTTTGGTSDAVTVTGMTSAGHCSLTATNASAATNIATTYISAKTTNQITVTHTATGSMTYDVLCTVN